MDSTGAHTDDYPHDPTELMALIDDGPWNAILSHGAYRLLARLVRLSAARGWETSHTLANSTLGEWLGKSARQGRRVRDELGETDLLTVDMGVYRCEGSDAQSATLTIHPWRFAQGPDASPASGPAEGERDTSVPIDDAERDTYVPNDQDISVPMGEGHRDTSVPNEGDNGTHPSRTTGHICPPIDYGMNDRVTDARARAREEPVPFSQRPMGRASLPNHYPLDYPDGVVERADALATWAMGAPLSIRHGATSTEWRDVIAECQRLGVPDEDIKAKLISRTAAHVCEHEEAGNEPDPIHSLVYHTTALMQWAQSYDPAAKKRVGNGRPPRGAGFVGADDDTHQADAEAWRARRANG